MKHRISVVLGLIGFLTVTRLGGQTVPQEANTPAALRVASVLPVVAASAVPEEARLFRDTFDTGEGLRSRYFEYDDTKGSFVWSADKGYGDGGAMQCRFEKGQVTAGSLKLVFG